MKSPVSILPVVFLLILSVLSPNPVHAQSVWSEEEVVLNTSTGDLSGTLTLPDSAGHPPIVLIIAGSGPTDRNCNSQAGAYTNAYMMLAHGMAEQGIATLRYDKRGVYKSMAAAPPEKDLRFTSYVDDAVDWVKWIHASGRFGKVIVIGHSEGSLLGILTALKGGVDAFVSLAGPGENIAVTLKKQLSDLPEDTYLQACQATDSLRAGYPVKKFPPSLFGLFRPSVQPYMISWMAYEPTEEIARLKIPVLIVQGTTDIQVETANADRLHEALPGSELLLIDGMNHVLKPAPADLNSNRATYMQPDLPLKEELLPALISFIHRTCK